MMKSPLNLHTLPRVAVILLAMSLLLVTEHSATATSLKWTGCGITRKAFMTELAKAYKQSQGVMFSLSGGGATKGIRAVNSGSADMGGSCRPALPHQFPDKEGDVYMTVVAWDALVPIVHASNPVTNLTSAQLRDVLTGKITNWKELGGPDHAILVVARKGKVSGVGYTARQILFHDPNLDYAPGALLVRSSGPLENKVQSDPYAIGITGISSAHKRIAAGKSLKTLSIDGVAATPENIASGKYAAVRPLYITTKGRPTGADKAFLDWVLSPEGQKIIEQAGTVSVSRAAGLKARYHYWQNPDRIVNFASLP